MLARLRTFFRSSGFVLNFRRVWLLILLWAILASLALQTQRDLFFRLSYLILLVVLVSFVWAVYSIQSFRLERRLVTPRTQVGKLAEERFVAVSTGRLPKLFIELDDFSDLPGHRVSRVLNALAPRVRYSWNVRTLCRKRGRYRLGPLTVTSGDPFGLFLFRRAVPDSTFGITVYPMVIDLPTFAAPIGYLRGGDALQRRTHIITTNVAGTREYIPGDTFNRIHWASSAKHGRLIVKEFELDPTSDVWIFLDLEKNVHYGAWWQDAYYQKTSDQLWGAERIVKLAPHTEEYTVTIAASIARYFINQQRAVGMIGFGERPVIIQPDRSERQLVRLFETLGVVQAQGRLPFSRVLAEQTARLSRNITLVLVTPSVEPDWIRYAQEMRRRGHHLVAVLVDVASFGAAVTTQGALEGLVSSGVTTYVVREGDDLRAALVSPIRK